MEPKIDVFLCRVPGDPLRRFMYEVVRRRWEDEPGCTILDYSPKAAGVNNREFQRERRIDADGESYSPIYVLADDDCLPQSGPVTAPIVEMMKEYIDFGIISLMPSNAVIHPWTPPPDPRFKRATYYPYVDENILEHESVGGIRFIRKGLGLTWPPMPPEGPISYDRIHCEQMRKVDYRVGYAKNIKMNHLGEGYSTIWSTNGKEEERHSAQTRP